jgi:hypothetical protein
MLQRGHGSGWLSALIHEERAVYVILPEILPAGERCRVLNPTEMLAPRSSVRRGLLRGSGAKRARLRRRLRCAGWYMPRGSSGQPSINPPAKIAAALRP